MVSTHRAHAKIVLAGEHAVLRGKSALVMPCHLFNLYLQAKPSNAFNVRVENLNIDIEFVHELFELALYKLGVDQFPLFDFKFYGNFPKVKGLGFSAAISSVIAKWCCHNFNNTNLLYLELAHDLENYLHGNSSGLDIIGVNHQGLILFNSMQQYKAINAKLPLKIYLHCCVVDKDTKSTQQCVAHVSKKNNYTNDDLMQNAVDLIYKSLIAEQVVAKQLFIKGINLAQSCFKNWQLVSNKDQEIIDHIMSQGALAAKITGAGGGGSIISLWDKTPQKQLNLAQCVW